MSDDPVRRHMERCRLCPRRCGARRAEEERGLCGADGRIMLASATKHSGEEPPISGTRGSGTFFFSHCPLSCCFCQNFPISHLGHGTPHSIEALAERMLRLEKRGAHNINVVTGTQYAPHIVDAVERARASGMAIPIVWNTSGYETPETIDLLEGTVDIYLTDIKYVRAEVSERLTGVRDYYEIACAAAKRMFSQVGPLVLDEAGVGAKGVIVRHMVLPNGLSDTETVMAFVHETFGDAVPVSLMAQYFPTPGARRHPDIARPITRAEYDAAKRAARAQGIEEGWFQEMDDPTLKRGA